MRNRTLLAAPRGSAASDHLDMIRGIAALAVLLGHARHLFFVGGPDVAHFNVATRALYFATSFAHQAVIVFFVLSGFFVGSSVLRSWQQGRWSWKTYLTTRLTRLYIVLLPALILGVVWDGLGMTYGHPATYFTDLPDFGRTISSSVTPRAFLGSLFFLQDIATPSFGSNGALWSLASEFWYYMLFPLGAVALLGPTVIQRIVSGVAGAAILIGAGAETSLYFSVWLLGVLVAAADVPLPAWIAARRRMLRGALLAIVVLAVTFTRFRMPGAHFAPDFAVSLVFAAFLHVLLSTPGRSRPGYSLIARRLSAASYTIYLAHLPILCFLRSVTIETDRWQPDVYHIGLWLSLMLLVSLYICLFYWLTERHTDRLRSYVTALLKFGGNSSRPIQRKEAAQA